MTATNRPGSVATAAVAAALPERRRRLWPRLLFATLTLPVALIGAGYFYLGTQDALEYVLHRAVTASEGRLSIEGGEGSLLSTVRIRRILWRGDDVDVEAEQVALTWNPTALLSPRIAVSGLGARRLAIDLKPTPVTAAPESLALPVDVDVRNVGVARLEWSEGTSRGAVTGIAFDYSGDALGHHVRNLSLVLPEGALSGELGLGAQPPFAASGTLAFAGAGEFDQMRVDLALAGMLEQLDVDARGNWKSADVHAKARVTPFAEAMFTTLAVNASDVDLARFAPALPRTGLTIALKASPAGAGIAGTIEARNNGAGTIDAGRVPVDALAAHFALTGETIELTELNVQIAGNGRASGRARLPIDGKPLDFELAVRDVNLLRLHSSLVETRLSGKLAANVAETRQSVRGELRQADMGLEFAATIEGKQVVVERFRARTGGGELVGNATAKLDGTRDFMVDARALGFDPARFAAVPPGKIDGTVAARGALSPELNGIADISVANGSRFAEMPISGHFHAAAKANRVHEIKASVAFASAKVTLSGAYGGADDALAFTIDAPKLPEFKALLTRYAVLQSAEPLAGSLRARGTVRGDAGRGGLDAEVTGKLLQWGRSLNAATLEAKVRVAPAPPEQQRAPVIAGRPLDVALAMSGGRIATVGFTSLQGKVAGTLDKHAGSLAAAGDQFDFAAGFSGGLAARQRTDGSSSESAWAGTLDTLTNRGNYALELVAPATVEVAPDRVRVGSMRLKVAEGRAELAEFIVDDGRVTTHGSFTAIPAAALARLAGNPLPFASTLELGGEWSLDASPRLNGTIGIRRERGDGYAGESTTIDPSELALGISALEITARFVDDAISATAVFQSTRFGNAEAKATLGASDRPGEVSMSAPLTASVSATMPSLRPLQPWLGTLATMDGKVSAEFGVRGTPIDPLLTGTLTGDALRFDLPQYGVHLKDGRLRARLADRTIVLEDFSFGGGAGRFAATGTLVRAGVTNSASVQWQATDFTVVNRPDLRLVARGKGKMAIAEGKLSLDGAITVDEGRVVYVPTTDGKLSDDVVIVGQTPAASAGAGAGELPLKLDLDVALGRDFRFSGEGLETRLAGKVRITTAANGSLAANGAIRAVSGTYYVFGTRLEIDRGSLIFDGPADNPALDIVALRKNLAVEAGVEVTGTVRVPRVRLVSNPPVPDGEKLSWLITGQGVDRASSADLAALSTASASLLAQGRKPITTTIANSLGLDDISVRSSSAAGRTGGTGSTSGQVVAFGKRLSDRVSLVYEQGLTVADNALRLEYRLSRFITLRAEAGVISSIGAYFRRSYE